ncbi:MAG: hypothetical protein KA267_07975, partial [Gemmatimonadales bacterium]|nr:hypothetical protein [Gemmatimonadales bacterium]MBP6571256.1 hypothetical protein [Gemmatimonadales bacterium]
MRRFAFLLAISSTSATSLAAQQLATPTTSPRECGACVASLAVGIHQVPADTGRLRAIEYSDAYAVRLKIHRIASYAELPLFAAEYFLGEKLLRDQRNGVNQGGEDGGNRSSARGAHSAVAAGLGVLFTVNTVTGGWNLYESRKDPSGRTRKWIHTIAMLAADAG